MRFLVVLLFGLAWAFPGLAEDKKREPDPFAGGSTSSVIADTLGPKFEQAEKPSKAELEPYLRSGWKCVAGGSDGKEGGLQLDYSESVGVPFVRITSETGNLETYAGAYALSEGKSAWVGKKTSPESRTIDLGTSTTTASQEEINSTGVDGYFDQYGGRGREWWTTRSSSQTVETQRAFCIRIEKDSGQMYMEWSSKVSASTPVTKIIKVFRERNRNTLNDNDSYRSRSGYNGGGQKPPTRCFEPGSGLKADLYLVCE